MEGKMKIWSAVIVCALFLTTSPLFACEIGGLTDAINRLKGGAEPNARYTALACTNILQNKDVLGSMANLVLILHLTFDKDSRLKDAITDCPVDVVRRAC
jgi:hypothetical protein